MITILEEGDRAKAEEARKHPVIFRCLACGCRWKAEQTDYTTTAWTMYNARIVRSVCPCCNEVVSMETNC